MYFVKVFVVENVVVDETSLPLVVALMFVVLTFVGVLWLVVELFVNFDYFFEMIQKT